MPQVSPQTPPPQPSVPKKVDMARAQAWFQQHWKAPVTCPVCKNSAWTITEDFAVLQPASPTSGVLPYVIVACNTCTHVLMFSAVGMGLWPPLPRNV